MRILLHSNGPNVPTGYGVQTALLAQRLQADGHEVAISVYYGHQTGLGNWNGIPLLPCAGEAYGNDIIHEHALRWFDGDALGGWIIPIMDVFGLHNPTLADFNVAAWTPVDHVPVPKDILTFFAKSQATPIAMSKFGQGLLDTAGLDPLYAPLVIDTAIYRPVDDAKTACGVAGDRFVVMMNGMNKGWALHRKGYPEAFYAFAQFAKQHDDALLYVHAEQHGPHAQGISLTDLAVLCGIRDDQIRFADQYAYRCGFVDGDYLAALYSAADVFLAPSRGEGFCVPLIEAQACGTPVIVTDFSAQPELVGAGWKVDGEPEYDAAQQAWVKKASIPQIVDALGHAYDERDSVLNREAAISRAREYDADLCYDRYWRPILAELAGGTALELDRAPIGKKNAVAVIVPALNRPQNVRPLLDSFQQASGQGVANLYYVCDPDDIEQIAACEALGVTVLTATRGGSFAQKINAAYEQTTEPWLFVCGDDVRFHRGWIDQARKLSDRYDVIGTNDTPHDAIGNPRVATGSHADHFFVRRSYIDTYGASLDGEVCHEGYGHFYSDVELIELAKARGVYTPCLASIVEHLHPDIARNAARAGVTLDWDADPDATYKAGWGQRDQDRAEYERRRPLIAMQRTGRSKVRAA